MSSLFGKLIPESSDEQVIPLGSREIRESEMRDEAVITPYAISIRRYRLMSHSFEIDTFSLPQ